MRLLKAHIYDDHPTFALCGAKMERTGTPYGMRYALKRQRRRILQILQHGRPGYFCGSCTRLFKNRIFFLKLFSGGKAGGKAKQA